ncbi:hypothetical protein V8E53_010993 [Lactarius tabidus]
MTSILTVDSTSPFDQGEGPPLPPPQLIEELMDWSSSALHSFPSANTVLTPIAVSAQAADSKAPVHAHANAYQVHPEGTTTLATAVIPFSGRAVPTMIIVSLVPLHLGTGQYPPDLNPSSPTPLDQAGGLSQLPPSHLSGPSYLSVDDLMTGSHTPIGPRYDLEYAQTPSDFLIVPRNSNPRSEASYGYQPPGHGDPIQEPIPNNTPPIVIATPNVAVHLPSFNQTLGTYLTSGHPLSSSLVNCGIIPPTHTTHNNEESRQTRLLDPTYPTNTVRPIRRAGVDQRLSRHQCSMCDASYLRPSGLNRHYKDKHMAWMACHHCNSEFSLGRMYKFTEHLQTCPGA